MNPERGRRRPAVAFISVVLPAPFGPMTQTISPTATSRSMPASAVTGPYPTTRLRTLSMRGGLRACAKVGGDDFRMRPDDCGFALCDAPPEIEDEDVMADRHHDAHVVLHQEHRHALGVDRADHFRNAPGFRGGQTGGGFVEQEHLGIGGQ